MNLRDSRIRGIFQNLTPKLHISITVGMRRSYYRGAHKRGPSRAPLFDSHLDPSSHNSLRNRLKQIDRQQYGAYKDIKGEWVVALNEGQEEEFGEVQQPTIDVLIDKVQSDPFAPPSQIRVRIDQNIARLDEHLFDTPIRKMALCDYLARQFYKQCQGASTDRSPSNRNWHSSKGGTLSIPRPSQFVIPRSSVQISKECVEIRADVSLPAGGRTIEGNKASKLLTTTLPQMICRSILTINAQEVSQFVNCVEDQHFLRSALDSLGLIAFIGNQSILPRVSGVDDRPLVPTDQTAAEFTSIVVPFESPPTLEVTVALPHKGPITGMGLPKGVTLVVGGGFHGKTTLLEALQFGIYNKVPGDGREYVVIEPNAVKIRAENGRAICGVDLSLFINNLPMNKPTNNFSTANASGSTSQAANIVEAVEMETSCLLLDEDSCATNFMSRDKLMKSLVSQDQEPITPFIHRICQLHKQFGVSTILVAGSSGDYFSKANVVLQMSSYKAVDVTEKARCIAARQTPVNFRMGALPATALTDQTSTTDYDLDAEIEPLVRHPAARQLVAPMFSPTDKVRANGLRSISHGISSEIDLTDVEQFVEHEQLEAVKAVLQIISEIVSEAAERRPSSTRQDNMKNALCLELYPALFSDSVSRNTLSKVLSICEKYLDPRNIQFSSNDHGLDLLFTDFPPNGHLSGIRRFEVAAAINRLRSRDHLRQELGP